jgi:hypothetical protein
MVGSRPARRRGAIAAVLAAVIALAMLATTPAEAGSRFDGDWAIYIFGAPGSCFFGYRLPIRINGTNVLYRGRAVSPRAIGLSSRGAVAFRFGNGVQTVSGSGALVGQRGGGKWTAPGFRCTGSWRAFKL